MSAYTIGEVREAEAVARDAINDYTDDDVARIATALREYRASLPPVLHNHATAEAGREPPEPGAFKQESRTSYVLNVCLDGVPEPHDYDAIEETIEATGEAICRYEEEPTKIVTLLLSEKSQDYRAGQAPSEFSDKEALDELNLLLSAAGWPGPSGMEDVCDIVRKTGRKEVPNAPEWPRH